MGFDALHLRAILPYMHWWRFMYMSAEAEKRGRRRHMACACGKQGCGCYCRLWGTRPIRQAAGAFEGHRQRHRRKGA